MGAQSADEVTIESLQHVKSRATHAVSSQIGLHASSRHRMYLMIWPQPNSFFAITLSCTCHPFATDMLRLSVHDHVGAKVSDGSFALLRSEQATQPRYVPAIFAPPPKLPAALALKFQAKSRRPFYGSRQIAKTCRTPFIQQHNDTPKPPHLRSFNGTETLF